MDPSLVPPPTMLSLLHSKEVIAFDGDAIHPQSFTKFLVNVLAHGSGVSQENGPTRRPKLLAYRLNYSDLDEYRHTEPLPLEVQQAVGHVSGFLDSWHGKVVTLHEAGHVSIACEDDLLSPCCDDKDHLLNEVTIFVKTLIPSCRAHLRCPYAELGLQGLLNSKSMQIMTVGGGMGVGNEHDLYRTHIPSLRWHVWPVSRVSAHSPEEHEECYFVKNFGDEPTPLCIEFLQD